jgi:hypothetical protein
VIVLGSQAILGTFGEDELPVCATMSGEVDILPIADSNEETAQLADRIEGVAEEFRRSKSFTASGSMASTSCGICLALPKANLDQGTPP